MKAGSRIFGMLVWLGGLAVVGTAVLALTVVFSLIFMMPIFRGLMFVILVFAVFLSLMIFISRSDLSKWPIVSEGATA